jgi:hypothetical protein
MTAPRFPKPFFLFKNLLFQKSCAFIDLKSGFSDLADFAMNRIPIYPVFPSWLSAVRSLPTTLVQMTSAVSC